jgi:hypothetical protein
VPLAMAYRAFSKHLPDDHLIEVERTLENGRITEFCVRLHYRGRCICRYDTAHGFAHKDVLRRRHSFLEKLRRKECLLEKVDCTYMGEYKKVFEYALCDFTQNYAQYSQRFENS